MPAWTIISPENPVNDPERHPMWMNVYRVMKAVYHVLDTSNEPSSTIDEVKHIATLEYALSQEKEGPPEISSLVIHLRLSSQTDARFDVALHDSDMQIKDKVQNTCISLPGELAPVLMDISWFVREFVIRRSATIEWTPDWDCSFGRRMIWDQMQKEKYHQRVSQQETAGGTDTSRIGCSSCPIGRCKNCRVLSCRSANCCESSEPPIVWCARHENNVLCLPCLEEQGSKRELEKCPACKSWCCSKDIRKCIGHPINIPSVSRASCLNYLQHMMTIFSQPAKVHPPKYRSCGQCKLLGWRRCPGRLCWSKRNAICPECTSGGITCACQKVWACDVCAEHDSSIFIRCPRCDRPFCTSCTYIDRCRRCSRATLCYDCAEETSDVDECAKEASDVCDCAKETLYVDDSTEDEYDGVVEKFATLSGTCGSCGEKVCSRCAPKASEWFSCAGCQKNRYSRTGRAHARNVPTNLAYTITDAQASSGVVNV
ncbi:uncharacterized protein F5147DRAFT_2275 [Suillus discolor]|uniref:Uncharacterized protein n=1 Tax=Suillus discolor TaxID=1912936 RepID=A0A9P7K0T4_9AGAM|nr:uncharacterized protein F5147DRAFT_2275 [Suillus discolor]KAG2120515.1 hypothetical protein F5147DRAFT_2275 [Suillus discolor]